MREEVIIIPELAAQEIQRRDIRVRVMESVLSTLIESHAYDESSVILDSPLVKEFILRLEDAKMAFEIAKDCMLKAYISDEMSMGLKSWNLDYYTYALKCEFA